MQHFSASQLTMYERCPKQWEYRYAAGERMPPGIALLVGTGVHGGAETAMRAKMESGTDMPANDVKDIAVDAFDARMAHEEVLLTPEERAAGEATVVGAARDRVATVAHFWACTAQTEYDPALVEHRFGFKVPSAGVQFVGLIDLVDSASRLVDWKTGTRKRPQHEADVSDQLTGYAISERLRTGQWPSEVRLDCLLESRVANKPTRRVILSTTRGPAHYDAFLYRLRQTLRAIRTGVFPPCDPSSWWCSSRWCGWAAAGKCKSYVPELDQEDS